MSDRAPAILRTRRLLARADSLPRRPGVYLFKDAAGDVLYVGKAKSLRDRVRSYFSRADERTQVSFLLSRARDMDFIVTGTEKEALLLENTLIKEHRPRYNFSLKDDKGYASIRIGRDHPFPGISLTRRVKEDGARYFGPYDSAAAAREAVEGITRYFRVRSCLDREFANRVRPCLKHDIGRCTAPCAGRVTDEEYEAQVAEAEMFLSGQRPRLMRILDGRMDEASASLRFEEAARLRDVVTMLKGLVERQGVVRHGGGDCDAVGIALSGRRASACILKVRRGALVGKAIFPTADSPGDMGKIVEEILLQRYRAGSEVPDTIAASHRPESPHELAGILSERASRRIRLAFPSRGHLKRLVDLAKSNALEAIRQRSLRPGDAQALRRLGERLKVKAELDAIECVDISNLGGREAVGSLVCFEGGVVQKPRYRIYNIRTLATPDDYGMMREVLNRRYSMALDGAPRGGTRGAGDLPLPDLLLVDGGKGQLAVAKRVMDEIGLKLPLAAIAKGKGEPDKVFVPGRKNPLPLGRGSMELKLLMRIRDEAHRFCIAAHRRRRRKAFLGKNRGTH